MAGLLEGEPAFLKLRALADIRKRLAPQLAPAGYRRAPLFPQMPSSFLENDVL